MPPPARPSRAATADRSSDCPPPSTPHQQRRDRGHPRDYRDQPAADRAPRTTGARNGQLLCRDLIRTDGAKLVAAHSSRHSASSAIASALEDAVERPEVASATSPVRSPVGVGATASGADKA